MKPIIKILEITDDAFIYVLFPVKSISLSSDRYLYWHVIHIIIIDNIFYYLGNTEFPNPTDLTLHCNSLLDNDIKFSAIDPSNDELPEYVIKNMDEITSRILSIIDESV